MRAVLTQLQAKLDTSMSYRHLGGFLLFFALYLALCIVQAKAPAARTVQLALVLCSFAFCADEQTRSVLSAITASPVTSSVTCSYSFLT